MNNGEYLIVVALILGAVGLAIVRLTPRTACRELVLRKWAKGLGIVTGFGIWFADHFGSPLSDKGFDGLWAAVFGGLFSIFFWFFALVVLTFLYQHILAPPFRVLGYWRHRRLERKARRQQENERLRHERQRQSQPPGREQATRETDARSKADAQQQAQAQQRRELARMDCELLWIAYAPAIQQQFSKPDLEAFLGKYMGDVHPPEFVEERAAALKTTMTTLYTSAEPTRKYKSIEEAIAGFDRAKQRIAQEHFEDPDYREYLNIELDKLKGQHLAAVIKNMGG